MAAALSKSVEKMSDVTPGISQNVQMAALIDDIANRRSKQAFAALFEYFAPRLKSFMMRKGADAHLAEDLVQDTMLSVWNKASLYSPARGSVSAWIFTIARNLRIDRLRRQGSYQFVDIDDYDEISDDPASDDLLIVDQERTLVREALEGLPEDQMEIIRMSYIEDMPQSEIAKRLKIPLGTVKSRMRLAYSRLRPKLETTK